MQITPNGNLYHTAGLRNNNNFILFVVGKIHTPSPKMATKALWGPRQSRKWCAIILKCTAAWNV